MCRGRDGDGNGGNFFRMINRGVNEVKFRVERRVVGSGDGVCWQGD